MFLLMKSIIELLNQHCSCIFGGWFRFLKVGDILKWKTVCLPMFEGGRGLCDLHLWNQVGELFTTYE